MQKRMPDRRGEDGIDSGVARGDSDHVGRDGAGSPAAVGQGDRLADEEAAQEGAAAGATIADADGLPLIGLGEHIWNLIDELTEGGPIDVRNAESWIEETGIGLTALQAVRYRAMKFLEPGNEWSNHRDPLLESIRKLRECQMIVEALAGVGWRRAECGGCGIITPVGPDAAAIDPCPNCESLEWTFRTLDGRRLRRASDEQTGQAGEPPGR